MTDWTEPDHADEEWVQPWEEEVEYDLALIWASATPMMAMACGALADVDLGLPDSFSPRARWVSDRE